MSTMVTRSRTLRIMSLFPLIVGALLALSSSASAGVHPDYEGLKLFRTYWQIEPLLQDKPHFEFWVDPKPNPNVVMESERCVTFGNSAEEVQKNAVCDMASVDLAKESVPKEVSPLAEAIKAVRPWANVTVKHLGNFRTVKIREIIPLSRGQDPERRNASVLTSTFRLDGAGQLNEFPELPGQRDDLEGLDRLCRSFKKHCQETPIWIDHSLPEKWEGRSLLKSWKEKGRVSGEFPALWKAFSASVNRDIHALEVGAYSNPLPAILSRQGDSILPPGRFTQRLRYTLQFMATHPDYKRFIAQDLDFEFDPRDAMGSGLELSQSLEGLGVNVKLRVDGKNKALTVEFSEKNGETKSKSLALCSDVIEEDGRIAWARPLNAAINIQDLKTDDPGELKVSPSDGYTSFSLMAHEWTLARDFLIR